jgi:hypothetical protein
MAAYDHYSVASQIAQNLRHEGNPAWAAKLEEAIQFGSTGTEIFMALRWELQQFLAQSHRCTLETQQLIEELVRELNRELERQG